MKFYNPKIKVRYESFGGIISLQEPPALLYVDKACMKQLGYRDKSFGQEEREYLSAPIEVHFSLTNFCPLGCHHCYLAANSQPQEDELTTSEVKKIIKLLKQAGVFHIAFGGGEVFARGDFLEIAHFTQECGLVPNVTTNGFYITPEVAQECKIFGRINVSLDGVGEIYQRVRGIDGFKIADKAIKLLVKARPRVGINCVVTRVNFPFLSELVDYASAQGVDSILFLRLKPVGRGKKLYKNLKLTAEQNKTFLPLLLKLASRSKVKFQIDCSFTPMVYYHRPEPSLLQFLSAYGCVAGDSLSGITPSGEFNACSFAFDNGGSVFNFPNNWHSEEHFNKFRTWIKKAPLPCSKCSYLMLCKGGCHIVAESELGNFFLPDPDCPWVEEFLEKKGKNRKGGAI
jgi:radical SAM protein with 4Fe4S-binding SPASM domain